MKFCIICKEIANSRYVITVTDTANNVEIKNHVCAGCYEKLFSSHHNDGWFGVSKLFTWLRKGRKDLRRH